MSSDIIDGCFCLQGWAMGVEREAVVPAEKTIMLRDME